EGGVGNTFRLLRNVMGLWLVQGIRRGLERPGSAADYAELTRAAAAAPPFAAVIDPDAAPFFRADDMAQAIRDFCISAGPPPAKGASWPRDPPRHKGSCRRPTRAGKTRTAASRR